MFFATTHAKFYSAINTVGIAPCIVGKSNMFRKSHLDKLTDPSQNPIIPKDLHQPTGIDYFSSNICEDHLIGDLLWRSNLPGFANHGLVFGDLAIQPMAGMSVAAYIARRVRWLRARKWTVITATLVEPGVESLLCNAYFSFALTTIPWFRDNWGIRQTWGAMGISWLIGVLSWMVVDTITYWKLHTGESVEVDGNTPAFARGTKNAGGTTRRPFREWLPAWIGREVLALPIWTWAVLLGTTVTWRGKSFHVGSDMRVVEIGTTSASDGSRIGGGHVHGKEE
jgi:ceramide glucosyltransferase